MSTKSKKYKPPLINQKMPAPVYSNWKWQDQALCNQIGGDDFFYEDMERGEVKDARIQRALAICAQCPVIDACRQFALDTEQNYGIWGGMTQEQRAKLRKKKIHDI